ncbi:hypothetical protein BJ546DRAFT_1061138 [Cryomyces antarcticus]
MRDELTMLKAELFEGAQKIHQQNVQEESLRGEVENLKKQLKVAEDRVAALSSNEDELVQKVHERTAFFMSFTDRPRTSGVVEKMRANLSKEANRLRTEAVAELENKVHQMAHQKSQADARLANTTSELELSKARLQTLVKETKLKDAEIQTHKRTQASTEQKLQQLQQSLQMSDVSNKEIDAIKENARALEKQVHSKDAELLEAKQSHATNIKKLEELQEVIEKADVTKTALELELDRERGAADRKCKEIQERTATYINQLWQRLESSETNRKDGELLVARMHSQADSALKEQKGKSTLALEELQRRLSEAEADSKENELTHQEYRQEAEEAFKKQQEKYKGEIGEMQRRLSEIEASKRATGASEEVQREFALVLAQQKRDSDAEKEALQQKVTMAETTLVELKSRVELSIKEPAPPTISSEAQSNVALQIKTPPATTNTGQTKKPRRKVDRTNNTTVDVNCSSQAASQHVTDISSATAVESNFSQNSQEIEVHDDLEDEDNELGLFEQLDERGVSALSGPHSIPETQFTSFPMVSFAQLNESLTLSPPSNVYQSSSALSEIGEDLFLSTPVDTQRTQRERAAPGDPRVLRDMTTNAPPKAEPQASSQRDIGTGDYQALMQSFENKPMGGRKLRAPPNTASKMAPSRTSTSGQPSFRHGQDSMHPGLQLSHPSPVVSSSSRHVERVGHGSMTDVAIPSSHGPSGILIKQHSSPDYLQRGPLGSHKVTTYHHPPDRLDSPQGHVDSSMESGSTSALMPTAHSQSANATITLTRSVSTQPNPPKRSLSGSTTQGYEQGRAKKSKGVRSPGLATGELQSQTSQQPSQTISQAFPTNSTQSQSQSQNPYSVPESVQSRMRSSSQTNKGNSGKAGQRSSGSKSSRYNLRFSQELGTM